MTTTKDKHTPGPWHYVRQGTSHFVSEACDEEFRFAIAKVFEQNYHPNGGEYGMKSIRDEAIANARLITAAPLMLVELRETLRDLSEWDGTTEALQIIRANLTAAIEKATKG